MAGRRITKNDIIRIHNQLVANTGEEKGILSPMQLERTIKGFNEERNVYRKVAILLKGIADKNNQVFDEGNKRTAITSAMSVLQSRHIYPKLDFNQEAQERFMIDVVQGMTISKIERKLREVTGKVRL